MRKLAVLLTIPVLLVFTLFIVRGLKIAEDKQEASRSFAKQQFEILTRKEKRQNEELYLPILLYHYVEVVTDLRDTIRQSLSITPHTFESQLTTLLGNGYEFVTFDDLSSYWEGKTELPPKPVILTFDDGYRDFYTDVFPILKKYRVPATLFMVSGYVDSTHNYLTYAQLLEIARSELVEIGAHSVNHLHLGYVNLPAADIEIGQSKIDLEKMLGIPISHFAYPYGGHTPEVTKLTSQKGFLTAATTDRGVMQSYADRFVLHRIRPGGFRDQDFLQLIAPPPHFLQK